MLDENMDEQTTQEQAQSEQQSNKDSQQENEDDNPELTSNNKEEEQDQSQANQEDTGLKNPYAKPAEKPKNSGKKQEKASESDQPQAEEEKKEDADTTNADEEAKADPEENNEEEKKQQPKLGFFGRMKASYSNMNKKKKKAAAEDTKKEDEKKEEQEDTAKDESENQNTTASLDESDAKDSQQEASNLEEEKKEQVVEKVEEEVKVEEVKKENKEDTKKPEVKLEVDTPVEEIKVEAYRSSIHQIDPQLLAYLMELLSDPYNKWCLDCKMNQSTHTIVIFGIFVCESCCNKIVALFDRQSTWPKRVLSEQWDDYQLRHVAKGAGGNRPIYNLLKEYQLESSEIKDKYTSKVMHWYAKRLQCIVDGTEFAQKRPAKTWGELWDRTADRITNKLQRAGKKTKEAVKKVGDTFKKNENADEEKKGGENDENSQTKTQNQIDQYRAPELVGTDGMYGSNFLDDSDEEDTIEPMKAPEIETSPEKQPAGDSPGKKVDSDTPKKNSELSHDDY